MNIASWYALANTLYKSNKDSTKTQNSINYDSFTFKNDLELIPYNANKTLYIGSLLSVLVAIPLMFISEIFMLVPAVTLSATVGLFAKKIRTEKTKILQRFAQDNNWQLLQPTVDDLPSSVKGAGRKEVVRIGVVGILDETPFLLFNYEYVTGNGKNSRTISATIVRFTLDKSLPYILLDSQKNRTGAARIPSNAQHQSLEGDFDKYFRLYIQDGAAIEALSFITPDVMQTLIQSNSSQDIEIVNNQLFLICAGDVTRRDSIQSLFISSRKILSEIIHKTNTYRPNIATTQLSAISYATNQKYIPSRTRTFNKVFTIVFAIIFILMFIWILNLFIGGYRSIQSF